eukprot:3748587-Pleurochrysis_carterae.AAC.2
MTVMMMTQQRWREVAASSAALHSTSSRGIPKTTYITPEGLRAAPSSIQHGPRPIHTENLAGGAVECGGGEEQWTFPLARVCSPRTGRIAQDRSFPIERSMPLSSLLRMKWLRFGTSALLQPDSSINGQFVDNDDLRLRLACALVVDAAHGWPAEHRVHARALDMWQESALIPTQTTCDVSA